MMFNKLHIDIFFAEEAANCHRNTVCHIKIAVFLHYVSAKITGLFFSLFQFGFYRHGGMRYNAQSFFWYEFTGNFADPVGFVFDAH